MKIRIVKQNNRFYPQVREWLRWKFIGIDGPYDTQEEAEEVAVEFIAKCAPVVVVKEYTIP